MRWMLRAFIYGHNKNGVQNSLYVLAFDALFIHRLFHFVVTTDMLHFLLILFSLTVCAIILALSRRRVFYRCARTAMKQHMNPIYWQAKRLWWYDELHSDQEQETAKINTWCSRLRVQCRVSPISFNMFKETWSFISTSIGRFELLNFTFLEFKLKMSCPLIVSLVAHR